MDVQQAGPERGCCCMQLELRGCIGECVLMCGACWNAATPCLACTTAGRLENFFGVITTKSSTTGKRKEPESTGKGKGAAAAKKSKAAGVGKSKK